jgi:hypothetical protein
MATEFFSPMQMQNSDVSWFEWGQDAVEVAAPKPKNSLKSGVSVPPLNQPPPPPPPAQEPPAVFLNPDTNQPLDLPIVVEGETDTEEEDDVDENLAEDATEDNEGQTREDMPTVATANQIPLSSKSALLANKSAKNGRKFAPMTMRMSGTPLLGVVSKTNAAPRTIDTLTFTNAHGEKLYRDARAQLQPFAKITFKDALENGVISPNGLLAASVALGASMRKGEKFLNPLYNYDPKTHGSSARTVTLAASQLADSYRYMIVPASMHFLESGPSFSELIKRGKEFFLGKDVRTDPLSQDEQADLLNNEVTTKGERNVVDRDMYGKDNVGSLSHGRGELAVIFENYAKSTINWGVGFYRANDAMQAEARKLIDDTMADIIRVMVREKLLDDKSAAEAQRILNRRNEYEFTQTERELANHRVIYSEYVKNDADVRRSYTRKEGDMILTSTETGKNLNKANDANDAEKMLSAQFIPVVLSPLTGDADTATKFWHLYTAELLELWRTLAKEGESVEFDRKESIVIYLAYQIGQIADFRSPTYLQAHVDTWNDERHRGYQPGGYVDKDCPPPSPKCKPKCKPVCKPKCVTRYVYVNPHPCVEYVEPECVDVTCAPHCVERAPVCVEPTPPRGPCPHDPCMWNEVEVDCGPPCQNPPEICMKMACANAFGGANEKFMLKSGQKKKERMLNAYIIAICNKLKAFICDVLKPLDEEKRLVQAEGMAAAVIARLINTGTRAEVHVFSIILTQMMWILFCRLYHEGSCKARDLMKQIADYMAELSATPLETTIAYASTAKDVPLITAFVQYIQNGPRANELSGKFQLTQQDVEDMLPDEIRTPCELFHALKGALNAVRNKLKFGLGGGLDKIEADSIFGDWDLVYARMVIKLGPGYKPKEMPERVKVTIVTPKQPTPVAIVTRTAPPTTTTTTGTPATTPTTTTTATVPATAPRVTATAPATTVTTTGTTPAVAVGGGTVPAAPVQSILKTKMQGLGLQDDDDDEASDEFDKPTKSSSSSTTSAKQNSVEDLIAKLAQ